MYQTPEQAQASIDQTRKALRAAETLAPQRDTLSLKVQKATTQLALSPQDEQARSQLIQAQRELDDCITAFNSLSTLRQALHEAEQALTFARATERRQHCESLAAQFDSTFRTYQQQCATVLETFRHLSRLSQEHHVLTGRTLLAEVHHLPTTCTAHDIGVSIPTGRRG